MIDRCLGDVGTAGLDKRGPVGLASGYDLCESILTTGYRLLHWAATIQLTLPVVKGGIVDGGGSNEHHGWDG